MTTDLATRDEAAGLPQATTAGELEVRLGDLKQQRDVLRRFFGDVMVKDQDYGVIPGTQKPTLLKPGAEALAEFYGYAPIIRDIRETIDEATGFYRCVVILALVSKRNGVTVAEGLGEANTKEGRYRSRWLTESKLPEGVDPRALKSEERPSRYGDGVYTVYLVENDDPYTLWNTILKMAKKRALIDATLSATRSSGLFSQDLDDLDDWIEGAPADKPAGKGAQRPVQGQQRAKPVSVTQEQAQARADARAALEGLKAAFGKNAEGWLAAFEHFRTTYGDDKGVDFAKLSAKQCREIVEAAEKIRG